MSDLKSSVCTYKSNDGQPMDQMWFECDSCFCGCCAVCAERCHKNHKIRCCGRQPSRLCDCFHGVGGYVCQCNNASFRFCSSLKNKFSTIQPWYHCNTCNLTGKNGMCKACAIQCHYGHNIKYVGKKIMKCQCRKVSFCYCDFEQIKVFDQNEIPSSTSEFIDNINLNVLFFEDKTCAMIKNNVAGPNSNQFHEKYLYRGKIKYRLNQIGNRVKYDLSNLSCISEDFLNISHTFIKYYGYTQNIFVGDDTKIIHPLVAKCCPNYFWVNQPNPLTTKYIKIEKGFIIQNNQIIYNFVDESGNYYIPNSITHLRPYTSKKSLQIKGFDNVAGSRLKIIGKYAFCKNELDFSNFPDSLYEIQEGAFYKARFQSQIFFGSNSVLKFIGKLAFLSTNLRSIQLPSSIISIGKKCFKGCYELCRIDFSYPSQLRFIGKSSFKRTKIENIEIPSSVEEIEEECFCNSDLKCVTFLQPSKLKKIMKGCFQSTYIESIEIPSSVEEIEEECFWNSNLKYIHFQDESQLKLISKNSFSKTFIEAIEIPKNVLTIEQNAFSDSKLEFIRFFEPSNLKSIDTAAFSGTLIHEILLPSSLEEIGKNCFANCPNLIKVEFPYDSKLRVLHDNALEDTNITNLTLPPSLEEIGSYCFKNTQKLKNIKFAKGSSIKKLKNWAFGETYIEELEIPSSLEEMGEFCFKNSTKLQKITFEKDSKLKRLKENAFNCSSIEIIELPSNLEEIGNSCFMNCPIKKLTIPSSVLKIDDACFYQNKNLEEIKFLKGSNLQTIGTFAFSETQIKSITIPSSVISINESCFNKSSLVTIKFEKNSQLKIIEKEAFKETQLKSIDLPNSVEEIGDDCFESTNITYFKFPKSLKNFDPIIFGKITQNIELDPANPNYVWDGLSLYDRSIQTILYYNSFDQPDVYLVPPTVLNIHERSLINSKNIKTIKFHPGSKMKSLRFDHLPNSIESIVLPESFERMTYQSNKSMKPFNLKTIVVSNRKSFIFDSNLKTMGLDFSKIKIIADRFARVLWSGNSSVSIFKIERHDNFSSYFKEFENYKPVKNIIKREVVTEIAHDHENDDSDSDTSRSEYEEQESNSSSSSTDADDHSTSSSESEEENEQTEIILSDYLMDFSTFKEIKLLGKGTFGSVVLMRNEEDGKKYAVKTLETNIEKSAGQNFIREVEIMCNTCHPCIVKLFGFKMGSKTSPAMIALEYMPNGTVEDIFRRVRKGKTVEFFNNTRKAIIVIGIALGMRYLHKIGILHRDLKPANILLDKRYQVRIGDFGISKFEELGITNTKNIGTPFYAAPELYEDLPYDSKADVYSFGMILFEIAVGNPVFNIGISSTSLLKKKIEGNYLEIPECVLPLTRCLIERCLETNPTKRPTFDEIIASMKEGRLKLFEDADRVTVRDYFKKTMKKSSAMGPE